MNRITFSYTNVSFSFDPALLKIGNIKFLIFWKVLKTIIEFSSSENTTSTFN